MTSRAAKQTAHSIFLPYQKGLAVTQIGFAAVSTKPWSASGGKKTRQKMSHGV